MTDRRPQVYADDALRLTLEVPRTEQEKNDGRLPMDDGTVIRFLEWQRDNEIFPFRGAGSGPGFWTGTFPIEHKPAIMGWLRAEGLVD